MNGKKFVGIEELCAELKENYNGATFRDWGKNYCVVSVGEGTSESIIERLTARKKTKLIYLMAEETDE